MQDVEQSNVVETERLVGVVHQIYASHDHRLSPQMPLTRHRQHCIVRLDLGREGKHFGCLAVEQRTTTCDKDSAGNIEYDLIMRSGYSCRV